MTISLLSSSHPLLLTCVIDTLINLLHPAGELSVTQILLDKGEKKPVTQLASPNHPLDHLLFLLTRADIYGPEHGYSKGRKGHGKDSTTAADSCHREEEEEPAPFKKKDLIIDNIETENTESMVNIDCSSERSSGELAGGDGGEDLADRVHHVLADRHGSEEVVDGFKSQAVKHTRQEQICEMNHSKENTELKKLTEEKLSKEPVILLQSEDIGLY